MATSRHAFIEKSRIALQNEDLAREVIARCAALAAFSEDVGSIRRTFLSPPMHDCHRELERWLNPRGVTTHIDAVGNLHGLYAGLAPDAPRLLLGSHLDTVPNAGAYDGVLGVILAIALIEALDGRQLPFAIELVAFSEEEGVRFGVPFIGSRALAGTLSEEVLSCKDRDGTTVREAIVNFGLNPLDLAVCTGNRSSLGYLEFHIEQGPVLETMDLPLAAVEAIAGQSRLMLTFLGRSNHAGTTPMNLRQDALAGAAEWISSVERFAVNTSGLVATVGAAHIEPGAGNVIAREARLSLDVRHRDNAVRQSAVEDMLNQAAQVASRRTLTFQSTLLMDQATVLMNPDLLDAVDLAIQAAGCNSHQMVSGAGHDAMIMAEKMPTAMIFLRSPGGISHDPAESVRLEDVDKAISCGMHLLNQLASSPEFLSRNDRA